MQILNLTPSSNNLGRNYSSGKTVLCLCDSSDAGFTVALPDAKSVEDVTFVFKKINTSNEITVYTEYGQVLDGLPSATLTNQHSSITIVADEENWVIIGSYNL